MSDLHADALATLTAWAAPSEQQEALRARFVQHLHDHADGVERACTQGHLTAGVLVVDASGEHMLMTLHAKARRWFHLGGHLEPADATLLAAALREGREESGLHDLAIDPVPAQLDAHTVPFCAGHAEVEHLDVRYVARAREGLLPTVSDESIDVRWWPIDAPPEGVEPELLALARIARERLVGD